MNKKKFIIIGLIACVALAAYLIYDHAQDAEEEELPDNFMTEEELSDAGPSLEDIAELDDEENTGEVTTLEDALPVLEKAGYVKTDDGYVGKDDVDGVSSVRIVRAEGNHVILDLSYDYGDANSDMIKFFKNDEDNAVSIMLSSFLTVLAEKANAEEGDMEYVVTVGGTQVAKGTMTLDEAWLYQAMAME